jgi:hypothetical protein
MKNVRRIIFLLVSLLCLLDIMGFPINKYEWMLGDDPQMTLKTLPIDHNASTYPCFAIAPILLLVMCILFTKNIREKKALILVGVLLLGIWANRYRYLLF